MLRLILSLCLLLCVACNPPTYPRGDAGIYGEAPSDAGSDREMVKEASQGTKCSEHKDCTGAALCVDGACQRKACQDGSACPSGMMCDGQSCECIGTCVSDADCAAGDVCKSFKTNEGCGTQCVKQTP